MTHEYEYLDVRINYKELAVRLKRLRLEHGLTQADAAELMDINEKVVSNIERCALRRNDGKEGTYGNGIHLEMNTFLKIINFLYRDLPIEQIVTIFEVV